MFEEAYRNYLLGFNEVIFLLKQAENASIEVNQKMRLANQQVFLRSAIVLMAARLEAFLKALPEVYSDAVSGDWTQQGKGQKRFLSLQISRNLINLLEDDRFSDFSDERAVEHLKVGIQTIAQLYSDAEGYANLANTTKLSNFYKLKGNSAIEKLLLDFREDGVPFFGWLHRNGCDGRRYKTVVEGLLNERNSIAHGDGNCSLTLNEIRSYLAVITHMNRLILVYLEES